MNILTIEKEFPNPRKEESLPIEQEPYAPPEPENITDQEGVFDEYNLPDDSEAPHVEEPSEKIPGDRSYDISNDENEVPPSLIEDMKDPLS